MITCGIATLKDRESSFQKVIQSIYPQVDKIIAVLNYYESVPDWIKGMDKIKAVVGDNTLGDSGKFLEVDKCNEYYFSTDDDLLYPPTYVADMIAKIKQYHCIVTLHGKRFDNRPIISYRRSFSLNFHCLHTQKEDVELHVGGTGTMAFDTRFFKPSIDRFLYKNMADIWLALQASEQNVKIMGIAHKNNYLKYFVQQETIWRTCKIDPYQTEILRIFLK